MLNAVLSLQSLWLKNWSQNSTIPPIILSERSRNCAPPRPNTTLNSYITVLKCYFMFRWQKKNIQLMSSNWMKMKHHHPDFRYSKVGIILKQPGAPLIYLHQCAARVSQLLRGHNSESSDGRNWANNYQTQTRCTREPDWWCLNKDKLRRERCIDLPDNMQGTWRMMYVTVCVSVLVVRALGPGGDSCVCLR